MILSVFKLCIRRACCRDPGAGKADSGDQEWQAAEFLDLSLSAARVALFGCVVCFVVWCLYFLMLLGKLWISDCAKFFANHPHKGIVSVLVPWNLFAVPIFILILPFVLGCPLFLGAFTTQHLAFVVQLLKEKPLSITSLKLIFIVFWFLKKFMLLVGK